MRRIPEGMLLTTNDSTQSAIDTAGQVGRIVLVNGERLAELTIDHDVGFTTSQSYELKKVDQDYFEDA